LFSTFSTAAIRYKGQLADESMLPTASLNKNGDYWEIINLSVT
jgi:hypothetical protein